MARLVSACLPYLAMTVLALLGRAWGLLFAPSVMRARPDEEIFNTIALGLFSADKNTHWAGNGWPELFFFVIHGAQQVYAAWLRWTTGSDVHLACLYSVDPIRITQLGRIVSCIAGTLTVPLTMGLARSVAPVSWSDRQRTVVSTLAGLFLALDYLHARDSHFGVSDPTLVLCAVAAMWAAVQATRSRPAMSLVLAGAFTGAAISMKWAALGLLPPLLFAACWVVASRPGRRAELVLYAEFALLVMVACLVAGTPHVLDEPRAFWEGLRSHEHRFDAMGTRYSYEVGAAAVRGIVHHSRVTLPTALGWPVLALSVAGLGFVLARPRGPPVVLAFYVLFFYCVVLGPTTAVIARYTLPVHPPLCVFAALAATWLFDRVAQRIPPRFRLRGASVPMALALVALPAQRIVAFDRIAVRPDTRDLASAWLASHMGPDDRVATEGGFAQVQALEHEAWDRCQQELPAALRRVVPTWRDVHRDWRGLLESRVEGYRHVAERAAMVPGRMGGRDERWLVQGVPMHRCGRPGRSEDISDPGRCYERAATFSPGRSDCDTLYDTDQVYVPMDRFAEVERMGPVVTVWRRTCR